MSELPCEVDAKHEGEVIVHATGVDDAGLPLVRRLCRPCSVAAVEAGDWSFNGQVKFIAIMADQLREQVEKLTKSKEE